MSRSLHLPSLSALAATAFIAAAAPVLAAGTASATENDTCQSATVQYRIVGADGNVVGADWTSQGGFHQWDTVPGTVEVRLAPRPERRRGLQVPVSLAEYTAEGSTWYTSGHQTMVDKATVYLTAKDVAGADDAGQTLAEAQRQVARLLRPDRPVRRRRHLRRRYGRGPRPAPLRARQHHDPVPPHRGLERRRQGDALPAPRTRPPRRRPSRPRPRPRRRPPRPAARRPADETTPPPSPKPSTTPPTSAHVRR
ncbi:hypothetical protein ACRAWF_20035 [Streptomyces sp. L7]